MTDALFILAIRIHQIFDTSDDSEDDSGDLDIEQDIVLKGDTLSIRVVVMG
jgi:hypothetical protein